MNHDPRFTDAEHIQADSEDCPPYFPVIVGLTAVFWLAVAMGLVTEWL